MKTAPCIVAVLLILILCPVSAEPPPDIATIRSERAVSIQDELFGSAISRIANIYNYPVNIELSPEEDQPERQGKIYALGIRRNEKLASSLDRMLLTGDGMYARQEVMGHTVIRPTLEFFNMLDLPVTIDLTDATIWEAIKAVAVAVNRHPDTDKRLEISVPNVSPGTSHLAPTSFTQDRVITLQGGPTTVRSLIFQIFSQAPVRLSYMYGVSADWHVLQLKFLTGLVEVDGLGADVPIEVQEWWNHEREDIADAFNKR